MYVNTEMSASKEKLIYLSISTLGTHFTNGNSVLCRGSVGFVMDSLFVRPNQCIMVFLPGFLGEEEQYVFHYVMKQLI